MILLEKTISDLQYGGKNMELTYFYLRTCPHCCRADEIIRELIAENPKYADVKFRKVEESEEKELADSYDYWYVPCFYLGTEKLMEGVPSKEKVKAALDRALLK